MRCAALIFNPVAGQGDASIALAEIRQHLESHFQLTIYQTDPAITTAALTKQALEQGAEVVIAAGGDGTLSAVAGALLHTQVPIGVIARGTANAFANALGIPLDIAGACQTIIAGQVSKIDVAKIDVAKIDEAEAEALDHSKIASPDSPETPNLADKPDDSYPLLLLAGIGFEAATIEGADRESKDRLGSFAYLMSAVKQLQNLEPFQVELETAERVICCSASAITIANAAPATSILAQGPAEVAYNDGLLDVRGLQANEVPTILAVTARA